MTAQTLRPYQTAAVADAAGFISRALVNRTLNARRAYAAPTGSGKGTIQLAVQAGCNATLQSPANPCYIITPSLEVIRGFLARTRADGQQWVDSLSEGKLWENADALMLTTPVRLRNRLQANAIDRPRVLIVDEMHHAELDNVVTGDLAAMLADAVWLGYTATPFRGTPAESVKLREQWGEPVTIITLKDAVAGGFVSIPTPRVVPLLDDDVVTVASTGEFQTRAASAAVVERHEAVAELVRGYFTEPAGQPSNLTHMDRPTVVAVPGADARAAVCRALGALAVSIDQDTPTNERTAAYRACRERRAVLVQVGIVGEGVDMPWLRRLIDVRPMNSPVAWFQLIGRITRPVTGGEAPPEYICCTRNLERHAYLFDGVWPSVRRVAAESQDAFGGPSQRAGARVLAMKGLGRFARTELALIGGGYAQLLNVGTQSTDPAGWNQVLVLLLPGQAVPSAFNRFNPKGQYGKWTRFEISAEGLEGWGSGPEYPELSVKQRAWWDDRYRGAPAYGIATQGIDVSSRGFAILPALADTRTRLQDGTPVVKPASASVPLPLNPKPAPQAVAAQIQHLNPEPVEWLEVDGDTFPVRDELRQLGCRFESGKWYAPMDGTWEDAQRIAPRWVKVEGKTFPVKDALRALGCRFREGAWFAPQPVHSQAQALVPVVSYRAAVSPAEVWVARALATLSHLDPDRAAAQNNVGFNKLDGDFGHSLAEWLQKRGTLTDGQWSAAVKLCRKYHRQVGQCPQDVPAATTGVDRQVGQCPQDVPAATTGVAP